MEDVSIIKSVVGNQYILIPATVFWSIIITIVTGIIANFVHTWNRVKYVEKEISMLKVNVENSYKQLKLEFERDHAILELHVKKDSEVLSRIEEKLDNVNKKQIEIEQKIILKEDKKFT